MRGEISSSNLPYRYGNSGRDRSRAGRTRGTKFDGTFPPLFSLPPLPRGIDLSNASRKFLARERGGSHVQVFDPFLANEMTLFRDSGIYFLLNLILSWREIVREQIYTMNFPTIIPDKSNGNRHFGWMFSFGRRSALFDVIRFYNKCSKYRMCQNIEEFSPLWRILIYIISNYIVIYIWFFIIHKFLILTYYSAKWNGLT